MDPKDQEKAAFTCPFGVFAYRRMPFGLSNTPATFHRCMLAIFVDMVEKCIKVFMDDFSVFGPSIDHCLANLELVLRRCVEANLVLNWDVIEKLPPPVNAKGIKSFLGHAGFYRRFIKDFSKICRPLSNLLNKDAVFKLDEECLEAFQTFKEKLVLALIMVAPDWSKEFELM